MAAQEILQDIKNIHCIKDVVYDKVSEGQFCLDSHLLTLRNWSWRRTCSEIYIIIASSIPYPRRVNAIPSPSHSQVNLRFVSNAITKV